MWAGSDTSYGKFPPQLVKPMCRDLSPKQLLRSPLHRSRRNSHTQPTSDFGLMLLSAFLEPCSAPPASYQNPCAGIKHQIQQQTPSWLQDQYLHWTSKFQRVKAIRKQKEGLEQRDTFLFPHNNQLQHTGKQRRSGIEKNLAVPLQHGSYRGNSKV